MQRRTYEKKNAELTQSNSFPVGSPPSTSSGSPCSRAFPRFVRSRSGKQRTRSKLSLAMTVTGYSHAKRYIMHAMGIMRQSSFRTNARSSSGVCSGEGVPASEPAFSSMETVFLPLSDMASVSGGGSGGRVDSGQPSRGRKLVA